MIELTDEQRHVVASGQAVDVIDTKLEIPCIVMRKDVYERVRLLLNDDWTDADLRGLLARSSVANGWDEPEMAAYDHYDEEHHKRCP